MLALPLVVVIGYLIGAFPTSIVVGRRLRGVDVREGGSGNPGAANVLRLLGWKPALLVLLVDMAKGVLATEIGARVRIGALDFDSEWLAMGAGLAAIVGHLWPLYAGFRGGKGVAAAGGVILALDPRAFGVCLLVFVLVVWWTRRISVGSMAGAVTYPVFLYAQRAVVGLDISLRHVAFATLVALIIVVAHRKNLRNLLNGTEPEMKLTR